MIEFRCTECNKQLRTPDDKAGMSAKCPQCGAALTIPAAPSDEENIFEPDSPAAAAPPPMPRAAGPACPMCGERTPPGATRCPACGEPLASSRRGQPRPLRATEVFSRAWAAYQKDMGLCIGANVLVMGILWAVGMAGQIAMAPFMPGPGGPPNVEAMLATMLPIIGVVSLLQMGVQFWLWPGLRQVMLGVAKGEKPEVMQVFRGGRYSLRLFGASFLVGLLFLLIAVVILGGTVAIAVGSGIQEPIAILLIVLLGYLVALLTASLLIMPFFWPYTSVLVHEDSPGVSCLSRSLELTRGNRGQSLLLLLIAGAVSIVGLLLCGVGTILTSPLIELMMSIGYTDMVGETRTDV